MIISVKQKHIDKGRKFSPCDCPVSLALQDALQTTKIRVGLGVFYIGKFHFGFEDGIGGKINEFDRGSGMEPFEFKINIEAYNELVSY